MGYKHSHEVHVVSHPLSISPSCTILKWCSFVEPTIESDIYADKPFALGPMVATMNYLSIDRPEAEEKNVMVDEHVEINGMLLLLISR